MSYALCGFISVGALGAPTRGGAKHLDLVFLKRENSTEPAFNTHGRLNAARDLHLAVWFHFKCALPKPAFLEY